MKNKQSRETSNIDRPKTKKYSFQKTNKLLNKHGKAYRKQDLKPGAKRPYRPEKEVESVVEGAPVAPAPTSSTEDHYSELLKSLKKKPRLYFEELIASKDDDVDSDKEGSLEAEDFEEDELERIDEASDEDEDEEDESDDEQEDDLHDEECEETPNQSDNFHLAFDSEISPSPNTERKYTPVPNASYQITKTADVSLPQTELKTMEDLTEICVETSLAKQWASTTKQLQSKGIMKPSSSTIYPYMATYNDILFTDSNFENQAELLKLLALHSANHVIKTRKTVLKNNARLARAAEKDEAVDLDVRDQGFTRPKVLILFPFRNVAHKFVHQLLKLVLSGSKKQISNRKRFEEEYGPDSEEKSNMTKSLSYQKLFLGNNDDFFTLGLALAKNSVKLYTDFYNSDIIIASPLGLRNVIGGEGDKERDYDFLSSIEVATFFMTDVFLMQNWEHLLHCVQHLNLKPTQDRGTDFSRVKMWALDSLGRQMRQNIVFSAWTSPEISSLFSRECTNYRGSVQVGALVQENVLSSILYPVRQVFLRQSDKPDDVTPTEYITKHRYNYFVQNVLPRYQTEDATSIVIVIPSFFDYVRVRNYFKRESTNFAQMSEYSSNRSITNTRRAFAQGEIKYLLTTERFFFFKRYTLKNVQHVLFYEAPLNAECYTHYVNMLQEEGSSCTLLYNQFDVLKLSRIVGVDQCKQLINSKQTTHMIISQ